MKLVFITLSLCFSFPLFAGVQDVFEFALIDRLPLKGQDELLRARVPRDDNGVIAETLVPTALNALFETESFPGKEATHRVDFYHDGVRTLTDQEVFLDEFALSNIFTSLAKSILTVPFEAKGKLAAVSKFIPHLTSRIQRFRDALKEFGTRYPHAMEHVDKARLGHFELFLGILAIVELSEEQRFEEHREALESVSHSSLLALAALSNNKIKGVEAKIKKGLRRNSNQERIAILGAFRKVLLDSLIGDHPTFLRFVKRVQEEHGNRNGKPLKPFSPAFIKRAFPKEPGAFGYAGFMGATAGFGVPWSILQDSDLPMSAKLVIIISSGIAGTFAGLMSPSLFYWIQDQGQNSLYFFGKIGCDAAASSARPD